MLTVHLTRRGTSWLVRGDHLRSVPAVVKNDPPMPVRLPHKYATDLDSVPRVPLFYAWLKNRTAAAAAWHDYFYRSGYPRDWADAQFLRDMEAEGVKKRYRLPIYWGVRIFGSRYYRRGAQYHWWRKHIDLANDINEESKWNGEKSKN